MLSGRKLSNYILNHKLVSAATREPVNSRTRTSNRKIFKTTNDKNNHPTNHNFHIRRQW